MSYQQQGPGYGQPPAAQWGAPQPPAPKKKSKVVPILIGVGSFIVVLVIIGAATGSKNKSGDDAKGSAPSASQPAAPAADTTAPSKAPAKPKPKPKPAVAKTVLTESGHGIKTTAKFTVHGDWDLHYSYDCTSFGFQGNFIVTTGGTDFPEPLANEMGKKGTEVTHQHDGGTLYLDVNSECAWTLKVVDLP